MTMAAFDPRTVDITEILGKAKELSISRQRADREDEAQQESVRAQRAAEQFAEKQLKVKESQFDTTTKIQQSQFDATFQAQQLQQTFQNEHYQAKFLADMELQKLQLDAAKRGALALSDAWDINSSEGLLSNETYKSMGELKASISKLPTSFSISGAPITEFAPMAPNRSSNLQTKTMFSAEPEPGVPAEDGFLKRPGLSTPERVVLSPAATLSRINSKMASPIAQGTSSTPTGTGAPKGKKKGNTVIKNAAGVYVNA